MADHLRESPLEAGHRLSGLLSRLSLGCSLAGGSGLMGLELQVACGHVNLYVSETRVTTASTCR